MGKLRAQLSVALSIAEYSPHVKDYSYYPCLVLAAESTAKFNHIDKNNPHHSIAAWILMYAARALTNPEFWQVAVNPNS